jgi:DNA-directed RNA polymerase subunit omega
MAQGRNTLMDPPIEDLLDKVDSKFTLVALGSARARQVNSYYNSLGEGLGKVVPPQVASVSGKPVSIAFEEIAAGKATYTRPDPDEEAALAAAEADLVGETVLTEVIADDDSDETDDTDDVVTSIESDDIAETAETDETDGLFDDAIELGLTDVGLTDEAGDEAGDPVVAEADIEVLDVGDEDPTAS